MPKKKATKKKGSKKKGKKSVSPNTDDVAKPHIPTPEEKLWAARFAISEKSRKVHRENATTLVQENSHLQDKLQTSEKDTIQVITFLKKELAEKEEKTKQEQERLQLELQRGREDLAATSSDFREQLKTAELKAADQQEHIDALRKELGTLKDFRKRRAEIEREVRSLQEDNERMKQSYEEKMQRMENRFFQEKMRLHKEAEHQMVQLADTAHDHAMRKMDITTKTTYSDNLKLTESLKLHISEDKRLKEKIKRLTDENETLKHELASRDTLSKTHFGRSKRQEDQIKQLTNKVETLEASLSQVGQEFETETRKIEERYQTEILDMKAAASNAEDHLALKQAELRRIKALAKNLLDQRSDIEVFFIEALEETKSSIAACRDEYKKVAQKTYNAKMQAASRSGKSALPAIQTFSKSTKRCSSDEWSSHPTITSSDERSSHPTITSSDERSLHPTITSSDE